jgi:leader peptidase (prepilin peptidase) / N-methyltransferase
VFADSLHLGYVLAVATLALFVSIHLIQYIPARMEREWRDAAKEYANGDVELPAATTYGLSSRGRASVAISLIVVALALLQFRGWSPATALLFVYFAALVVLVAIDFKHLVLPDLVVLPIMWLGLLQHALFSMDPQYVLGAALGYVIPRTVLALVKVATGKVVMGYGDLKVFAMAGAWFGAIALPMVFVAFVAAVLAQAILQSVMRSSRGTATGLSHFAASLAACVATTVNN